MKLPCFSGRWTLSFTLHGSPSEWSTLGERGGLSTSADHLCRQPFYPDASRIFEEIDRLGIGHQGTGNLLSSKAEFDFYRPAPSGGYRHGLLASERTDIGEGDISPETLGKKFFAYRPSHIRKSPSMGQLAQATTLFKRR